MLHLDSPGFNILYHSLKLSAPIYIFLFVFISKLQTSYASPPNISVCISKNQGVDLYNLNIMNTHKFIHNIIWYIIHT